MLDSAKSKNVVLNGSVVEQLSTLMVDTLVLYISKPLCDGNDPFVMEMLTA